MRSSFAGKARAAFQSSLASKLPHEDGESATVIPRVTGHARVSEPVLLLLQLLLWCVHHGRRGVASAIGRRRRREGLHLAACPLLYVCARVGEAVMQATLQRRGWRTTKCADVWSLVCLLWRASETCTHVGDVTGARLII